MKNEYVNVNQAKNVKFKSPFYPYFIDYACACQSNYNS